MSKTEIEIFESLPVFQQEFLEEHLGSLKPGTRRIRNLVARMLLDFLNKGFGEITPRDALDFCKHIDTLVLKRDSKTMYLSHAREVTDKFLQFDALEKRKQEIKRNPFDVCSSFKFAQDSIASRSLKADAVKLEKKVKTVEQIKKFLVDAHQMSIGGSGIMERAMFYIALLQVFSAPRISENVTIRLENFDCETRVFKSGLEECAEKAGEVTYALPKVVCAIFAEYIADLKAHGESEYLFPGRIKGHLDIIGAGKKFTSLGINSHAFRHTMETFQRKDRINLYDMEYLSNHKQRGTVAQKYVHFTPEDRVKLYDECLPPEYTEILNWLETL